jgi:hypothetical protein
LNQFCQNFVNIWRSYIVNSNINVKVLPRLGYWCLRYVCISVCLTSTPCTFNNWQSVSFTYSKYSGNLQTGHTSNLLLNYFWVSNCSKFIYGSIPVSDDLQEMRGYCKLKEEALYHCVENMLWNRLLTCHQTDNRMNEWPVSIIPALFEAYSFSLTGIPLYFSPHIN